MLVVDVGAGAEVAHQRHRAVDDAGDRQVQRAEGTGACTDGGADICLGGEHQRAGDQFVVGSLDLVQLMVAAHDQGDQLAFLGGVHHQGLDGLLDRQAELFHQGGDGLGLGSIDQAQFFAGSATSGLAGQGLGLLDVGGVVGGLAEDDIVFTGSGQHVEFVGTTTADGAVVRLHGTEIQAEAGEDLAVRAVHDVVGRLQRVLAGVEGVGILHDELAATHQAEARTDLVTELGLDLVHVDRQLLVAVQLIACQIGNHFLVRRADAEVAVMTILQAQQLGAVLLPATGFLPQFGGLDGRHQHLQGTGGVHFFANDGLHLAQHPQTHWQPGVQTGRQLADHAGAQHQLMADHDRIGRGFFQGGQQVLTGTHLWPFCRLRRGI